MIDLLYGQAVHAIRGERNSYKPVQTILCDHSDTTEIAKAIVSHFALNEIYVADLNAIQYGDNSMHRALITSLALNEKIDIILDSGISETQDALAWLNLGIHKIVIGSETLDSLEPIRQLPRIIAQDRAVFSLDLRSGEIVSRCPELRKMSPMQALERLQNEGWREVIILDLIRVGAESGFDRALIDEAHQKFPDLKLFAGGGISSYPQLLELQDLGIAGVLLATALHKGIITEQHVLSLHSPEKKKRGAPL